MVFDKSQGASTTLPATGYADANFAIPAATTSVIAPAIGSDQRVPAAEASVNEMPTNEPVPSQVQVSVNDRALTDQREN